MIQPSMAVAVCGCCGQHPSGFKQRESASIESVLGVARTSPEAFSLCPYELEHRIVKTATKTMNALELVRKQLIKKQAVKEAQKANATTLCYRGNCYVKQTAS
jgi:hypothetical protein